MYRLTDVFANIFVKNFLAIHFLCTEPPKENPIPLRLNVMAPLLPKRLSDGVLVVAAAKEENIMPLPVETAGGGEAEIMDTSRSLEELQL